MSLDLNRKTRVTADWTEPPAIYPAYILKTSDRWNGFAEPFFDRETMERIVADIEQVYRQFPDSTELLSWGGDNVIVHHPQDAQTDAIQPNADGLFDMRLGWTWTEVEHESWF